MKESAKRKTMKTRDDRDEESERTRRKKVYSAPLVYNHDNSTRAYHRQVGRNKVHAPPPAYSSQQFRTPREKLRRVEYATTPSTNRAISSSSTTSIRDSKCSELRRQNQNTGDVKETAKSSSSSRGGRTASTKRSIPRTHSHGWGRLGRSRGNTTAGSTRRQESSRERASSSHIASVSISRNHGLVGCAFIDLSDQSQVSISELSENHFFSSTLSLLQSHGATTILIPDTQTTSRFGNVLEEALGKYAVIVSVNRKFYNESEGLELIQTHAANTLETDISRKYLALSAFATLIRWTEHEKHILFSPKALQIRWKELSGSLMIDRASARHLEIVRNARTGSSRNGSLFAALNFTKTAVGKRMLRARLLCPPNKRDVIESRLDSLQELLHNEEMFYQTQQSLTQFVNLDRMVSHLAAVPKDASVRSAQQSIRNLIALKHTLEVVPKLASSLSRSETVVLMRAREAASSPFLPPIRKAIDRILTQDTSFSKSTVTMIQQTIFAVHSGIDAELDIARMTYSKLVEALMRYVDSLQDEVNVQLRLTYTARRGYIFETPREKESEVPINSHAVRAVRQGKKIRWSTERLLSINNRINECTRKIFERLHPVLTGLRAELRASIGVLFELVNSIGNVDVCMSFAEMITTQDPGSFVRPDIDDGAHAMLLINEGRHPIVEASCRKTEKSFCPTDVVVGPIVNNVLITGSNGSGKSTLMKQVAIINVLAHASCFVPAKYAKIRLCDRIFTRIGVEDDMEANASTFLTEMKEVAFIIENSSDRSLVLLDEIGRGTSHRGGLALAWSICESIALTRPNAHVLCATHYLQLTRLSNMYPLMFKNLSLSVSVEGTGAAEGPMNGGRIRKNIHRVVNGAMSETEGYGIRTALESGFPALVLQKSRQIAQKVKPALLHSVSVSQTLGVGTDVSLTPSDYKHLLQRLVILKQSTARNNNAVIRQYLENLRKKFVVSASRRDEPTPKES